MAGQDGPNAEKRPGTKPGDNANCDVFTPSRRHWQLACRAESIE
jgi:hypothetical protein